MSDCRTEELINTKTLEPLYSYRVFRGGEWCWVFDDNKLVFFHTEEERDADMAALQARIAQEATP